MILYKYLPTTRIDVIENRKIRFTQYGAFNDPFELSLNINRPATKDAMQALAKSDFVKLIEEEYDNQPHMAAFISKEEFIRLAKGKEGLVKNAIENSEPAIAKLLPGLYQKTVNSLLGALSLSELNDNTEMWSHYAEEHKGYVIGFDSSNSFFNQRKTDKDELRHLRKIQYHESRPEINLMNTDGRELFFIKGIGWKYEAEVRMLLHLSDSSETIYQDPYPIHLFEFPPTAVSEIIFGTRMSDINKMKIKSALANDDIFSHIKYYGAHLGSSSFSIRIEKED